MTPERRREFETEWPALARRMESMLRRMGVPEAQREDVVQESALRLYRMWADVDPTSPPWPLAKTIALNIVRDRARRRLQEVSGEVPELEDRSDVERTGIARIELGKVWDAMGELTAAQRTALLAEVLEDHRERSTPAEKMLRMRARRKLTTLLERVSGIAILRQWRLNEMTQWALGVKGGALQGATCVACLVLGTSAAVLAPIAESPAEAAVVDEAPRSLGSRVAASVADGWFPARDRAGRVDHLSGSFVRDTAPAANKAKAAKPKAKASRGEDAGSAGSPGGLPVSPPAAPLPAGYGDPSSDVKAALSHPAPADDGDDDGRSAPLPAPSLPPEPTDLIEEPEVAIEVSLTD